jgi:hypothetical protein
MLMNCAQFFFSERAQDFPLYTEALKFFNHDESMVRIAVRTLTLNVYQVDEPALRSFILDRSAVPYFSNLVWFMRDRVCFAVVSTPCVCVCVSVCVRKRMMDSEYACVCVRESCSVLSIQSQL